MKDSSYKFTYVRKIDIFLNFRNQKQTIQKNHIKKPFIYFFKNLTQYFLFNFQ